MIGRWFHPGTEKLSRLLDEALEARAHSGCMRHLSECAPCRNLFEGLSRARAALMGLPTIEEHPLQQLQPPRFIPVVQPTLSLRAFTAGVLAGLVLLGILFLRPMEVPMRVISAPGAEGFQELQDMRLEPGVPLKALLPGDVDLEIPNQVLLRLKPGATVTWQQFRRPWVAGGGPNIVLNVMQGTILARTQEKFWGSRLEVRTPTASAQVKGTAFSVSVGAGEDLDTTLKVLAGSIFFSPYLEGVGVEVHSGEENRIGRRGLPGASRALSAEERKALLETYRIGYTDELAELVIGAGPERVDELLQPALLHLGLKDHPELFFAMRRLVSELNAGILEGDLVSRSKSLEQLERALEQVKELRLAIPLHLYVGAAQIHLGDVRQGRTHFRWVLMHAPQHRLAPMALAALGVTAERILKNPELAHAAFQQLASQYRRSPELSRAQEFLRRYLWPQS